MPEPVLAKPITPDWEAFVRCIRREGTPRRTHYIELFLDVEVKDAIIRRYDLSAGLDRSDANFWYRQEVAVQRFLGYDFVRCGMDDMAWPLNHGTTDDTAVIQRAGGRSYIDEHKGPITNWEEFERYPWPDPATASTRCLDWCQANLPDDMCIVAGGGFAHFAEHLIWLMGYETICYALYDDRDLVRAISDRLHLIYEVVMARVLEYDRVKITWGSDDLGYRGGTLLSPSDTREFILPGHKRMAEMSHAAGRPYLLHSCGNLETILGDLLDDVRIDAKHSFEDTIEMVTDAKARYGDRIALLGGIDVDFLCGADEAAIRKRVRETLDTCMPGGGYCLGTGNSVTNYIPVDNYLVMLDEGRRYAG
jgi:uroporphyrinogen decarboxylase